MVRRYSLALTLIVAILAVVAIVPPAAQVRAVPSPSASIACSDEDVVVTFENWTPWGIDIWYAPGVTNVLASPDIVLEIYQEPTGVSGSFTLDMPGPGTWSIFVGNIYDIIVDSQPITCGSIVEAPAPVEGPSPAHADDRLNNYEPYAPVAIYAGEDGANFYAVGPDGHGMFAYTLNPSALPAFAGSTQLVDSFTAQGLNFNVYWLETGELQVNVGPVYGKEYTYIFDADGRSLKVFHSF